MNYFDLLKAKHGLPVSDAYTALLGKKLQGGDYPVTEIFGQLPFSFLSRRASISEWMLYGKFVQNGTPSVQTKTLEFGTLVQDSYVSSTDGTITPYSSWDRTDYIAIPADMKHITVEVDSTYNNKYNCWYDENKQFISSFVIWNASSGTKILTADVPANAKYVIFSGPRNWMESASVEYQTIQPIPVQGVGERTANLFTGQNTSATVGGVTVANTNGHITITGTTTVEISSANSVWKNAFSFMLKAGTYYVSGSTSGGVSSYVRKASDDSRVSLPNDSFTLAEDTLCYLGFYLYQNSKNEFDIMINSGTTAEEFEPYGYKVSITNRGKNLFDVNRAQSNIFTLDKTKWFIGAASTSTVSSNATAAIVDGKIEVSTTVAGYGCMLMIPAKPQTQYYISFNVDKTPSGTYFAYSFRNASGEVLYQSGSYEPYATVTTYAGTAYLNICLRLSPNDGAATYSNIMVVEGSTALPYEPYREPITTTLYTDKPLYGDGTHLDYLQRLADGTGLDHREWRELVLDGTEDWTRETGRTYYLTTTMPLTGYSNAICTHYPIASSYNNLTSTDMTFSVSRRPAVFIHDDRFADWNELKAYLASQYASGTPVTVWYALETPTDTPVTLPELPTAVGTNVLDTDTTVHGNARIKGRIEEV